MTIATQGIEGLIKEQTSGKPPVSMSIPTTGIKISRTGIGRKTPVTYIAMSYHAGDRIMLTEAISVNFENGPAEVSLNDLEFGAHNMFLAHYSPMWIELKGDAKVTYVIPGRIEVGEGARINIMPSRIYVAPVGSGPLEAVLTSERQDVVMDVLRGKKYMLETRSPQLVVIDGKQHVNIDEVPMTLEGTAVITPRNLVRKHIMPLSLDLTNAEINYK